MSQTYLIIETERDARYIICGICGHKSYNPDIIAKKYCAHCYAYHVEVQQGVILTEAEKQFVVLALQGMVMKMGAPGYDIVLSVIGKLGLNAQVHQVHAMINDLLGLARKDTTHDPQEAPGQPGDI